VFIMRDVVQGSIGGVRGSNAQLCFGVALARGWLGGSRDSLDFCFCVSGRCPVLRGLVLLDQPVAEPDADGTRAEGGNFVRLLVRLDPKKYDGH
jgi:hypothetical protein